MAQRVNIEVTSDLSGKGDADTVTFGWQGATYEIDLTEAEAEKFADTLSKYLAVARKVTAARQPRKGSNRANGGPSPRAIREWANANGMQVPERGRIPADVRDAYRQAHKG